MSKIWTLFAPTVHVHYPCTCVLVTDWLLTDWRERDFTVRSFSMKEHFLFTRKPPPPHSLLLCILIFSVVFHQPLFRGMHLLVRHSSQFAAFVMFLCLLNQRWGNSIPLVVNLGRQCVCRPRPAEQPMWCLRALWIPRSSNVNTVRSDRCTSRRLYMFTC